MRVAPSGRSEEENREVQKLKEQVARILQIVQDNLAITLTSILPTLVESIANWSAGGRQGPCPIPSMVSRHSNNAAPTNQANYVFVNPPASTMASEVLVTPPAITVAPDMLVTPLPSSRRHRSSKHPVGRIHQRQAPHHQAAPLYLARPSLYAVPRH